MAKNKLVSVNILTHNAQDLIGPCLKSVLSQTYPNLEILVIDNASNDNTLEKIQNQSANWRTKIKIVVNKNNLGFSAGHNIGIKESRGEYVLCLNQDVVLDKDFVKYAVEAMKKDGQIGAIQGKLLKNEEIIDTAGLIMFKNRRVICRGQGEKDEGQYDKSEEVFGADGAAPLYRRAALDDIKIPIKRSAFDQRSRSALNQRLYEYFDEDFFMYKEDVDLAWRLQLYGWKAVYEPKAVGYHLRGAGERAVKNYLEVARARRKISDFAKYHSFKNQRLTQIKNELPALFFRYCYRIIIKEIAAWFYVLFFERYAWKAIKELFKQAPTAWQKRKIIMTHKKVGTKEIKKWIF